MYFRIASLAFLSVELMWFFLYFLDEAVLNYIFPVCISRLSVEYIKRVY